MKATPPRHESVPELRNMEMKEISMHLNIPILSIRERDSLNCIMLLKAVVHSEEYEGF